MVINQWGGFPVMFLPNRPKKLKSDFPPMKNVFTPLPESVLLPLGLTTAAWATDAAIRKKNYGSGMTTLIIMRVFRSFEESSLLIKGV